jgi:hypothetical protein
MIDLVFSNPVPGMEDEFNEWYSDRHVHEIVRVPGYVSAQRFRVTRHRAGGQVTASPALDPVFSAHFYQAIGEKVVKR